MKLNVELETGAVTITPEDDAELQVVCWLTRTIACGGELNMTPHDGLGATRTARVDSSRAYAHSTIERATLERFIGTTLP